MATINTFTSGINTSFGSELNTNFALLGRYDYRGYSSGQVGATTSTDWVTAKTVNMSADATTNGNLLLIGEAREGTGSWQSMRILVDGIEQGSAILLGNAHGSCFAVSAVDAATSHAVVLQIKKSAANSYSAHAQLTVLGL
jgi:hypothetical protein